MVVGIHDEPDQDPMVLLSRVIVVPGFDATKERIGSGHNNYIVVPFGGRTTRFKGPRVITVYLQCHLGAKLPVRGYIPGPY
ncbi:hypothetical protein M5K25_023971 [Dendrobium thyrsiflorum]|uniref:Uncharacterized protein n=1 Tax=Dendrobium thyrsiflorum TaxID=117978 RepID=A0ABD0U0N7_DENTH